MEFLYCCSGSITQPKLPYPREHDLRGGALSDSSWEPIRIFIIMIHQIDISNFDPIALLRKNLAAWLRIIACKEEADEGSVLKATANMKIAFLSQELEMVGNRTLREDCMNQCVREENGNFCSYRESPGYS